MKSSKIKVAGEWKLCSWYGLVIGCLVTWGLGILHHSNVPDLVFWLPMIAICVAMLGYSWAKVRKFIYGIRANNADYDNMIAFVLVFGFFLRAVYVIASHYFIGIHDLGSYVGFDVMKEGMDTYGSGHFGYIEYLYKYRQLPDFDPTTVWSFYNPPLFHIVSAIWVGVNKIFGFDDRICMESLQVITLCFSTLMVWYMYRILKEFIHNKKALLICTAFVALFPFTTIVAGMLNNDCFCGFFVTAAIWYTIQWQKDRSCGTIVKLALAIGLGMFSKLNTGLVAVAIGTVFLMVLWEERKHAWKVIKQYFVFGIICVPLGLFWPVRNLIKFDVPLNFVQRMDEDHSYFLGEVSLWEAFGLPKWEQVSYLFIQGDPELERNAWAMLMRTSLTDERQPLESAYAYEVLSMVYWWVAIILALLSLGMLVWMLLKKGTLDRKNKVLFGLTYATYIISFMKFTVDFPFIFTMHFRYILFIILIPCLAVGRWLNSQYEVGTAGGASKGKWVLTKVLQWGMVIFTVLTIPVTLELIMYATRY